MSRKTCLSALFAGVLAGALALGAAPASAEVMRSEMALSRTIMVPRDKSLAFRLEQPASKIVVAQPDIAKVTPTSNSSFYIQGKQVGSTNLLVYGPGGRLLQVLDIRVGYDAAALEDDLAGVFPTEKIHVRSVGEGLLLTGDVADTGVANRAKALADKYAPDAVTSQLTVRSSQQVVLEVRVLEATRSALQDLGLSATVQNSSFTFSYGTGLIGNDAANGVLHLTGGSGSTSIDVALQALEQKGIVRTLAKPNLVALSGEKASFLAGGEFPYPVPQGLNQITLEFRTYGVKLNFTPIVEDNGLIRLAVQPEVSQLDNTNALKINGVTVPGLITRRADTTVELRNGGSLAIGGLFQRDYSNQIRQIPGLGEVPILSSLFRSSRWEKNETELVIIVTPHLATDADFHQAATAQMAGQEPSAIDLILNGQALDKPLGRDDAPPRKTR
jgi:pilus assembly protein CpaC